MSILFSSFGRYCKVPKSKKASRELLQVNSEFSHNVMSNNFIHFRQAILVSPTSGQPYNQLGLLEASQGNKLSTVFYYIRGITVKNPFLASETNLSSTLNLAIDKDR